MKRNIESFRKGLIDGIPIALGYFAVSFTLGIRGGDVGLKWYQSALMSATNYTSAGQAAALSILEEGGSYIELVISTLVINLRYLLMSAALTIKLSPKEKTKDDEIEVVVQINGKVRAKMKVGREISKDDMLALAKTDENVKKWTDGKTVVKEIVVPGKLVNIVVK